MTFRPVAAIEVAAWGRVVGYLAAGSTARTYAFEYHPDWQRAGIEFDPINMPTSRRQYEFATLPEPTYLGLPPVIADSLPDSFGAAVLDAELAREGVARSSITALDRLAYISHRGMGALEFRPGRGPRRKTPTMIHIADLVAASRAAVSGAFDDDANTQAALAQLLLVGTSAGGARAKAVVAWNPVTGEVQSGQVPVREGFEHWLIKLDGTGDDGAFGATANWGRTEYAYHLMATAAGVVTSPSRLLEEGGRAHFMTKRFDREGNGKIHMASLCALGTLDFKAVGVHDYAQYFQLIGELGLGPDASQEAFRRMVFNVAAVNHDDHSKNFAFLLREGSRWQLAPAYDLTHANVPGNKWIAQHLMSVNGKFSVVPRDDLLIVADRFQVPDARRTIDAVRDAVDNWSQYSNEAGVTPDRHELVAADLRAARLT
jgi:serine/threonine-protein kinase HipA